MSSGIESVRLDTAHESARRRPGLFLIIGGALVSLVVILAVVSAFWTPYSPSDTAEGFRLGAPGARHWAGTDKLGRDLFTQLMIGARLALAVAAGAAVIAGLLGGTLGLVAASSRRRGVDESLSYVFDIMIAFPTILLAMLIVTIWGASTVSAILAIGISGAAVVSRVSRISALRVLGTDYVKAAATSGASRWSILVRHVLPNIYPILVVQLTLIASGAILAEASLAYLGLGAPPPQASWGRMLMEAQGSVLTSPWAAVLPGLAIVLAVMGFNFAGDGLRELLDPELKDNG
jgi:peptide/nickel transport system permease protein